MRIYKVTIEAYNEPTKKILTWEGEGNNYVGLTNWACETYEILRYKFKHVYWKVVVDDDYSCWEPKENEEADN